MPDDPEPPPTTHAAATAARAIADDRTLADTPVVVVGLHPADAVLELARALPAQPDGYSRRLIILEADGRPPPPRLASLLDDHRVTRLRGPDAPARLARYLDDHSLTTLPRAAFVSAAPGSPPPADIQRVMIDALQRQGGETARLRAAIDQRDARRTPGYHARRLTDRAGDAPRVLIGTTRFSTYVRHASRDLAEAFRALGFRARVLEEPDGHSRLAPLAWLDAFHTFDPDTAIVINYPRSTLRAVAPTSVPWVCWTQDALPHLFDRAAAGSLTDADFVVGHIFPELWLSLGYPRRRLVSLPTVACPRKFHDRDAEHSPDPAVAIISRHAETPDQLQRRLLALLAWNPPLANALGSLTAPIADAVRDARASPLSKRLSELTAEALAPLRAGPREHALALRQFVLPVAERVLRHQTLEWAAEIVRRRGWELRLYGKGWESHPTLARHARGEADHGEPLRLAYRRAAVTLHAAAAATLHQRVAECALSGGLPLVFWHADSFSTAAARALHAAAQRQPPDRRSPPAFHTSIHPELADLARARADLGLESPDPVAPRPDKLDSILAAPPPEPAHDPLWLLGPPGLSGYWDAASLESAVERAILDPDFRRRRSLAIADKVHAHLTTDAAAHRLVSVITERLAHQPGIAA
ncbi:MAG: hypothetical protein HRU70_04000 [Phycisphaeraceae bacterium]|nr:MAG: hypothetical protein HRU70_04000 [Phycisphaeraceae bacterium]